MVTTASTVKRCGALRPGASSWKAVLSWLFGGGCGGERCCRRERNQRKAKIKVMAMKSRISSASSITDRTEDPNQRLHWFPSWDSRVTTCKRWRKGSEDSPRSSLLLPCLLPLAVPLRCWRIFPTLPQEKRLYNQQCCWNKCLPIWRDIVGEWVNREDVAVRCVPWRQETPHWSCSSTPQKRYSLWQLRSCKWKMGLSNPKSAIPAFLHQA